MISIMIIIMMVMTMIGTMKFISLKLMIEVELSNETKLL